MSDRVAVQPFIQLPLFQGPLDLLLQLVERRRLPITELSLALVADQYLTQVRAIAPGQPDMLADFLVIGARLVLIKSRELLPRIEAPTANDDEPVDDLVGRLELYRVFKDLAQQLGELDAAGRSTYGRGSRAPADSDRWTAPLAPIDARQLAAYIIKLATRSELPAVSAGLAVLLDRVTVEERLERLRALLPSMGELAWDRVAGGSVSEIVATLLAVLEMIRRGELVAIQTELFGPITLKAADHQPVAAGGGAPLG